MKKTLAAVAVLGAFAGSALAADVQLYGIVDTGVRYLHSDMDKPNVDATDKFSMESGMASGSRWGIKGVEDLGNGLKVGFTASLPTLVQKKTRCSIVNRASSLKAVLVNSQWAASAPSTAACPPGLSMASCLLSVRLGVATQLRLTPFSAVPASGTT